MPADSSCVLYVFLDAIRVAKVIFNLVAFHLTRPRRDVAPLRCPVGPFTSGTAFSSLSPRSRCSLTRCLQAPMQPTQHTQLSRGTLLGTRAVVGEGGRCTDKVMSKRAREGERANKKVCSKQETQIYSLRSREQPGLDTFSLLRNSLGGIFTQPSPFGIHKHIHIAIHTHTHGHTYGIHIDILSAVLFAAA